MTPKNKSIFTLGVTFFLTTLVTLFKDFEPGYAKANWVIWGFFGWNFFAYGFGRDMWPWIFIELQGKNGRHSWRTIVFWGTAVIYLSFLATAAFNG